MNLKSLSVILLMGSAACANTRAEAPPPEHVVGKYVYEGTGSIAKMPWQAKADLLLERDGQYTLDFRLDIDDEKEHETSYGSFYVEGDKLVLDPADGSDHEDLKEFRIGDRRLTPEFGWTAKVAFKGLKVDPVFVKAD